MFTSNNTTTRVLRFPQIYIPRAFFIAGILIFLFILSVGLFSFYRTVNIPTVHLTASVVKQPLDKALQQPEDIGSITINTVENIPATVVMAGDSLARGRGSRETNGELETIGYYLVNRANSVTPGVARYQVIPGLAVDGSSVTQVNQQLQDHLPTLAKIPNLVLVLSFTNRDMQDFVLDAEKIHPTNRLGEFFAVTQILSHDSKIYQNSLAHLTQTLTDLHKKRQTLLGNKKAAIQAVFLGLPNEGYAPSVQEVLRKYNLNYNEFAYVINLFNADDREAAAVENNLHTGVAYSFFNLAKIHISQKAALTQLSLDGFHPNHFGYQTLTNYIAQNVLVRKEQQTIFLAKD